MECFVPALPRSGIIGADAVLNSLMHDCSPMDALQTGLQLAASQLEITLPSAEELATFEGLQRLKRAAKAGHRTQSLRCHPDRGGSHEQQVSVNLAHDALCSYVALCQRAQVSRVEQLMYHVQMTEKLFQSLRAKQRERSAGGLSVVAQLAAVLPKEGTMPAAAVRFGQFGGNGLVQCALWLQEAFAAQFLRLKAACMPRVAKRNDWLCQGCSTLLCVPCPSELVRGLRRRDRSSLLTASCPQRAAMSSGGSRRWQTSCTAGQRAPCPRCNPPPSCCLSLRSERSRRAPASR